MSTALAPQTTLANSVSTSYLPAFLILATTMEPVSQKTTTSLVHAHLALEGHSVRILPQLDSMALRI